MGEAKRKWYVVWEGFRPGVYDNWPDCQMQITGYPRAKYKSYPSARLAHEAFDLGPEEGRKLAAAIPPPQGDGHGAKALVCNDNLAIPDFVGDRLAPSGFLNHSIAVDAACSSNPGPVEYRGVYTFSHAQLFRVFIPWGTNNIGEFLAIVHAMALIDQGKLPPLPVYSDSRVAIGWVQQKRCRSRLDAANPRSDTAMRLLERAAAWLRSHRLMVPLLKWDTLRWGESPADFGRK